MKVLWITNILFPEAESLINNKLSFKESGGWMLGAANSLLNYSDIELSIATTSNLVKNLTIKNGEKICYYIIPLGRGRDFYNEEFEKYWIEIKKKFNPDIVHIHGTEYTHGLSYVKACGMKNVVVSIQGMKSQIAKYYLSGLDDIYHGRFLTFHDFIKGGLKKEQKEFIKSGLYEKELIGSVQHIIGRTSWDKAHVISINPNANYYLNNETLRPEFYNSKIWEYKNCEKHTIFISQASYPIKGLHQVIRAIPTVKRIYPDVKVRVAGKNITEWTGLKGFLHHNGYGEILKKLIRKEKLEDNIIFIGSLDAADMRTEYLKANLFICPSSIENSPNSLGEAQILGTPCLCSYVGGTPDFMVGNETYLYRFEEVEMLAQKIIQIFKEGDVRSNMRNVAMERHNPVTNVKELLAIYKKIQISDRL